MSGLILPPSMQRPKVTRETTEIKKGESGAVEKAEHHIKVAGDALAPAGMIYVGSIAGHIYVDAKDPRTMAHISQIPVGNAHEVWVEQAWQGLREKCQEWFGRRAPAKVKR